MSKSERVSRYNECYYFDIIFLDRGHCDYFAVEYVIEKISRLISDDKPGTEMEIEELYSQ